MALNLLDKKAAMTLEPLADRIVVQVAPIEEKMSKGGLHIPVGAQQPPQRGKVLAVGEGRYEQGHLIPMKVQVGDTVLFGRYSGTEVELEFEEVLIIREPDVLAIVR